MQEDAKQTLGVAWAILWRVAVVAALLNMGPFGILVAVFIVLSAFE